MAHPKLWGTTVSRNVLPTTTKESHTFRRAECQADFYDIRHVLVLGRVTSGKGGSIILETASKVLKEEFPGLSRRINLQLPDESSRRVGQSIAAASLPEIK